MAIAFVVFSVLLFIFFVVSMIHDMKTGYEQG